MWKRKLRRFVPKKGSGFFKRFFFWSFSIIFGLGAAGMIFIAVFVIIISYDLPDVESIEDLSAAQSTQIFDRDGNLLYSIYGEENREAVSLGQISKDLINATVALEDDQFWTHGGYDAPAILKSVAHEAFGFGDARGGSTLTQQYIKNTFLSTDRTYIRKVKELILALRLERTYSKEEILELYLNRIPYGNNTYGIQKASELYFDKDAVDLTLAESVVLASLPQAPSRYNPYGDNKYSHLIAEFNEDELKDRNIQSVFDIEFSEYKKGLIGQKVDIGDGTMIYLPGRADIALLSMKNQSYITEEEMEETKVILQSLEFNNDFGHFEHPHFVLYIKEILEEKYGSDVVEQGGLKVYTTLDSDLQTFAEEVAFEKGEHNESKYNTNNNAILTINAKTGEILAMVGSRDYFNDEIDGKVNVVFRKRQPGSSFKPFVFAQAFVNGYAPGNVIYDIPMLLGSSRPQNYDGSWTGQITIRKALAQSRNIPAIKAYYLAGEQNVIIELVEKMGILTLDKDYDYGYPLALGSGEVPLSQMVQAYATFANGGRKPDLTSILRVENANGDILEEWVPQEFEEVLDPQVAYLINNILSDTEYGIGPRLFINNHINAAKTGTSTKSNKQASGSSVLPSDAWTIGYTPTIVTGVWAGNTDGTGLGLHANGYDTAGPIFNAVMTKALEDMPNEPFNEPAGITKVRITTTSGKKPSVNTPEGFVTTDIFASFSVPTELDNTFINVKIDKVSGLLANNFTPEDAVEIKTYQNLEPIKDILKWKQEVRNYYSNSDKVKDGVIIGLPPKEYDTAHTAQTEARKPSITIVSPSTQTEVGHGSLKISVSVDAKNGAEAVYFYIDGEQKYKTVTSPYNVSIPISRFYQEGSVHLITAKVVDSLGYSSQSAVEVKISTQEPKNEEFASRTNNMNNDQNDVESENDENKENDVEKEE